MEPYSRYHDCPKCGGVSVQTRFHLSGSDCSLGGPSYPTGEHLHRTCERCGYNWPEAPLNA
jgi:predicted nucleic-acid-binding Zn-ribbon protein